MKVFWICAHCSLNLPGCVAKRKEKLFLLQQDVIVKEMNGKTE